MLDIQQGKKISVVTVCYNSTETIQNLIYSLNTQTYRNFEHIIIDGCSIDDTLTIVESTANYPVTIYSEPDLGIYDAMNKGLVRYTGDFIWFINSDDFIFSDTTLYQIAAAYEHTEFDIYCGSINYLDKSGHASGQWLTSDVTMTKLLHGWHTPHPGFILSRELVNIIGNFNLRYRVAADFDFMLRALLRAIDDEKKIVCTKDILINMRDDGESSRILAIIRGMLEIKHSFTENGLKVVAFTYFAKRYGPKLTRKLRNLIWFVK